MCFRRYGTMAQVQISCPECGGEFALDSIEVGEIIQCPECGVELEVLETDPINLGLAPDEEEDWGE
jgi:alpha-aminoadipate/glutamate carrier protein LysW